MAKDDYHVIVYQILSYLYVKLKEGESVDPALLMPDGKYINVNEKYWLYIMENLYNSGLIRGITITKAFGGNRIINNLEECEITPAGIEYLCDNSFLSKAREFLKDAKAIVPFV